MNANCGITKTPAGWYCMRELGHEGPCAAWPSQCVSELDELQHTLDLIHEADIRGIKMWQEATGRTMEWPDRGKLIFWLLERLDEKTGMPELHGMDWELGTESGRFSCAHKNKANTPKEWNDPPIFYLEPGVKFTPFPQAQPFTLYYESRFLRFWFWLTDVLSKIFGGPTGWREQWNQCLLERKVRKINKAVVAGAMTVNQARAAFGFDPLPKTDAALKEPNGRF